MDTLTLWPTRLHKTHDVTNLETHLILDCSHHFSVLFDVIAVGSPERRFEQTVSSMVNGILYDFAAQKSYKTNLFFFARLEKNKF